MAHSILQSLRCAGADHYASQSARRHGPETTARQADSHSWAMLDLLGRQPDGEPAERNLSYGGQPLHDQQPRAGGKP